MDKIPGILLQKAAELEEKTREKFPLLAPLAKQCFLNTIQTTVQQLEDGSFFVITGDIPAMWLRDSAAQLKPYIKYANQDGELAGILRSVIGKHVFYVNLDPYSNAFNSGPHRPTDTIFNFEDSSDFDSAWIWERKYELDSLCAPLYLSHEYYVTTGDKSIFTESFRLMLQKIVSTMAVEQHHWERSPYWFVRENAWAKTDTLPMGPKGRPVNLTGMSWSGFRPSDDACTFGYLIPANMMAAVALEKAAQMAGEGFGDEVLQERCRQLSGEIRDGIETYGTALHPKYGKIYAYETDGFGNHLLMDDANSPSLLAAPYLGYLSADDPVYQNTRRFILSEDNPYFVRGQYAAGVGSPHTPPGRVWHIGIVMEILTSTDPAEKLECLDMLARTHAGTNFMHESFDPNDPSQFSRPWFAWANTLFAQMLEGEVEE